MAYRSWLLLLLIASPLIAQTPHRPEVRAMEEALGVALKAPVAAEEDCGVNLLLCGEFLQNALTTRDCRLEDGGYADFWFLPASRGEVFAVSALSNAFNPLLVLFTPSSNVYDTDFGVAGEAIAVAGIPSQNSIWSVGIASLESSAQRTGNYSMLLLCGLSSQCRSNPFTLCLGSTNRYRVQVGYYNQFSETYGFAGALRPGRSIESGFFYFGSDPSNIELMVKILDFGGIKKIFWGQLTNLQYKIVVTDLATDDSVTYVSQPANCGGSDADAFDDVSGEAAAAEASCRAGKETACLLRGRFEVSGTWRNQYNGASGTMGASRISDLTSSFFFGSAGNIELLVKVADLGDRIGFFYGAMSDLEYTLDVKDTVTGETRTYHNPAGRYCGGLADLPK